MVRGPLSMVFAAVVMLFMFGLVALGPRSFERFLPESLYLYLQTFGDASMLAGEGFSSRNRDDKLPEDYLRDTAEGWKVSGPVAAMTGGVPVFIDEVMSGYGRVKGKAPGTVGIVAAETACTPTPPSDAARFAHAVATSVQGRALALWTYSDKELAAAVRQFAITYRSRGTFWNEPMPSDAAYDLFDIAVTETAAPVYLVVVGASARSRWIVNIALAPGARLERVVLLGGGQMGVANLPEGVPVEIRTADILSACGTAPFYPLNPGHRYFEAVASGVMPPEEVARKETAMAEAQARWEKSFQSWFGAGAVETMAGNWANGSVAVAGPLPASPEGRAVWKGVETASVIVTADQYLETPEMAAAGTGFAARVEAITAAFAWGDLGNLKWNKGF